MLEGRDGEDVGATPHVEALVEVHAVTFARAPPLRDGQTRGTTIAGKAKPEGGRNLPEPPSVYCLLSTVY
ncbi:MAG: hypothetical protein U9Q74_05770 [Gemmatimonadota bacterium]|nr:hypothetical protein [Gemmatimonadota bacterium]